MIRRHIDSIDLKLLQLLQNDGRAPVTEMARQVGMVPSAVHARLKKLEETGVLVGYEPRLDPTALGFGLTAFVFVASADRPGRMETANALALLHEVQEVHDITGEDCLLLKVRVRDMAHLSRVMRDGVGVIDTVRHTRTTVVFETVKETTALPLEPATKARRCDDEQSAADTASAECGGAW